jgi:hypothetical protein
MSAANESLVISTSALNSKYKRHLSDFIETISYFSVFKYQNRREAKSITPKYITSYFPGLEQALQ